jgi:guanylate kinase
LNMEQGKDEKIIILAAPSGAGKTTIKGRIMAALPQHLAFSVSATTRQKRAGEQEGVDYCYLTADAFRNMIDADGFVEWEMVYEGMYYGTTKAEMERIWKMSKTPLLDIDVFGAIKVKNNFGDKALSIFIAPPSIGVLKERLVKRGTDSLETINKRLQKADLEIQQQQHFDEVVLNDDLDMASARVLKLITNFLGIANDKNMAGTAGHVNF